MSRPLGPFVRLPTPEEVETRARAGAVVTVKQAPHGQTTTDLALRLQRHAATEREALSGDSTRAAELPRGRGVGSPAQLGPERDARAAVDKIGGDLGQPGSWTSQGRRPSAERAGDFVEDGPRSRAAGPAGRAPLAPPGARGPAAERAQALLAPGGASRGPTTTPGGVPDDGGVGRIREVVPGQGPNVDLSTGSKGGPTPHAFALEPGALRDPRQVPGLATTPAGVTEVVVQPPQASAADRGGGPAGGTPARPDLAQAAVSSPGPSTAGAATVSERGVTAAPRSGTLEGSSGPTSQSSGLGGTLARQQTIKVGLHGLARTLGVAPAGTRTADLTEVNASGAAAGEAAGEPPAGADRISQVPVLSPGGDERALGHSPPAASAGTGQVRGKGGGGVGGLAATVVEQSRARPQAYARAAKARTTYDSARADFKANVLAINAETSTTPQEKQALIAAAAQTHELARKGSELEAAQGEADATSEALRESHGRLASELQKSVPGQWSDRLEEALWDASTPSAIYQRNRDAITNNRLSADAVERAGKKYPGYVARNSSTALGKHFALSEVAAQTKRDAQGRGAANDALNQRQGTLTERADATRNGPAEVGGKRVLPLTTQERRELAKLRRDEPGRKAEDARLAKAAAKAEARRHAQVMKQGAKMAASLRKLADRTEAARASLQRKHAREADGSKLDALVWQLLGMAAQIEAARKEARAIEQEMETGRPPEEESADTPKPPALHDEVVPPGCPPDYKERCCPDCPPGRTCTCSGSSPRERGGAGPGGSSSSGASPSAPGAAGMLPWGASDEAGRFGPGLTRPGVPAEDNPYVSLADLPLPFGPAGADGWTPSDEEALEAARAWGLPELDKIDFAEAWLKARDALWEQIAGVGRFLDLVPPHARERSMDVLLAPDLQRLRDRVRAGKLTRAQFYAEIPSWMTALQREGFDAARVRAARAWLADDWPVASRQEPLFRIVREGPGILDYINLWPPARKRALADALAGREYSRELVGDPVGERERFRQLSAKLARDLQPKPHETFFYLLGRPLAALSGGYADAAEVRDKLEWGGPSARRLKEHVASDPGLAFLSGLLEFGGQALQMAALGGALGALGAGAKTSAVLASGISAGLTPDARAALDAGDWRSFFVQVAGGAMSAGVGAKVGQLAGMLSATKSSYVRGLLLGALAGAATGAAAGSLESPESGLKLERVISGALYGAMGAAAGFAPSPVRLQVPGRAAEPSGKMALGDRAGVARGSRPAAVGAGGPRGRLEANGPRSKLGEASGGSTQRATQFFKPRSGGLESTRAAQQELLRSSPPTNPISRLIDGRWENDITWVAPRGIEQHTWYSRMLTGVGLRRHVVEFDVFPGEMLNPRGIKRYFSEYQRAIPGSVSLGGRNPVFRVLPPNYGEYAVRAALFGAGVYGGYRVIRGIVQPEGR